MTDKIMDEAVEQYKRNFVQYKLTGNAAYKTAYENAQKWIDSYILQKQEALEEDNKFIDKFVDDYTTTNPDLVKLQKQMKNIRKEGPELQDSQVVNRALTEETPMDMTPYYVKAGIAAGLFAILVTLSLF
jgi:CHASE3 domain sensor protein